MADFMGNEVSQAQELFYHLIGKIIEEKINSFSELKTYLQTHYETALTDKRYIEMLYKLFFAIKRLNWGLFIELEKAKQPRLWQAAVNEDKVCKEAGDLKKSAALAGLCVASMNIHGYTEFLNMNKTRIEKLRQFDHAISQEAQRIAAECHSVCKFERGDELLVVSANPADCLLTTISIADFFSGAKSLPSSPVNTVRAGTAKALPEFKITAGIAGGQIPLIITETGNISGPVLNAAMCLQIRANELATSESCIMISKQTMFLAEKMAASLASPLFDDNALAFYGIGKASCNGVALLCGEVLFKNSQKYKGGLFDELVKLKEAVRQGLWERNVFICLMNLLVKAINTMPPFEFEAPSPKDGHPEKINNRSIEHSCVVAINSFLHKQNFFKAVDTLSLITKKIAMAPGFDKLILDYAVEVAKRYKTIIPAYNTMIEQLVFDNRSALFSERELALYTTLKKNIGVYEKLCLIARDNPKLKQRSKYWNYVVHQHKESLNIDLGDS